MLRRVRMPPLERRLHGHVFDEPRLGPRRSTAGDPARAAVTRSRAHPPVDLLEQLASSTSNLGGREGVQFLLRVLILANDLARRLEMNFDCGAALFAGDRETLSRVVRLQAVTACLPRRERETLALFLKGRSEKEVATGLNVSVHTVHVYAKSLYRRFRVESRTELLAQWVIADI